MRSLLVLSLIFCLSCIVLINGHSYMTFPIDRSNQAQSETGCRVEAPENCSVCDSPTPMASPTTIQRGQTLQLHWARNNHPGGFIRISWAPTTSSHSASVFDSNVQLYMCFEIPATACLPTAGAQDDATDYPGLSQTACGASITVPTYLTDGAWTLQWAWFGGYSILGDYYSCVDYMVSGGSSVTAYPGAYFTGSDRANPTNTNICLFRNTDRIGECYKEPCSNPIFTLGVAQTGAPTDRNGIAVPIGAPTGAPPSSSGSSAPAPVACTNDTQCTSGICESTGFCYVSSSKGGLGAGGAAALFFAFFFLVIIVAAVGFLYINRSEWSNWKLFNKMASKSTA